MLIHMKKIFCGIAVLALLLTMCACSSGSGEEGRSSSTGESVGEPAGESAPAPTETPAPTEEPEGPEVVPSETTNLLTGEKTLSPEAYGKRPVAVMVNNIEDCWPQYGISDADIIFEIPVEYNITRLMAVYGDYTKVPDVCSVRSCRYYYPMLAAGMDARYVHCGMDEVHARPVVEDMGIDNLDAANDSFGLFIRDQDKLDQGYAWEHTLVFLGTKYPEYLESSGGRTELGEGYRNTVFPFATEKSIPTGEACTQLRVTFDSAYYSDFTLDPSTGAYKKDHSGTPHMDAATEKQLAFENLLFLETEIHSFEGDESGRKEIAILGEDYSGYYVSEGKMQPIRWSKSSEFAPLVVTDEAGEELLLNQGKTYIAVCSPDSVSFGEAE